MKKIIDNLKSPGFMAVLTILSTVLGVYGTFFYERTPEIQLQLIAETNVLDIHEQLGKLDIFYDGKNLKTTEQTLRVITLRIANTGFATITKASYDENELLGFNIQGGKILETPEIVASSYLTSNLRPRLVSDTKVIFSPVILESEESFQVKLLILAAPQQNIAISPLGKIAGVKKISVTEPFKDINRRSAFQLATDGNIEIQILRSLIYFLTLPLALIVVLAPSVWIGSIFSKHIRVRKVAQFKAKFTDVDQLDQLILDSYIRDDSLWETIRLLAKEKELTPSSFPKYATGFNAGPVRGPDDPIDQDTLELNLRKLNEMNLVTHEGNHYQLKSEASPKIDRLVSFLT